MVMIYKCKIFEIPTSDRDLKSNDGTQCENLS